MAALSYNTALRLTNYLMYLSSGLALFGIISLKLGLLQPESAESLLLFNRDDASFQNNISSYPVVIISPNKSIDETALNSFIYPQDAEKYSNVNSSVQKHLSLTILNSRGETENPSDISGKGIHFIQVYDGNSTVVIKTTTL